MLVMNKNKHEEVINIEEQTSNSSTFVTQSLGKAGMASSFSPRLLRIVGIDDGSTIEKSKSAATPCLLHE